MKRRGLTLLEVLLSLSVSAALCAALVLAVRPWFEVQRHVQRSFERSQALESALAFVDSAFRYDLRALRRWDAGDFDVEGRRPLWADWQGSVVVRDEKGRPLPDGQWGERLSLMAPAPAGVTLERPLVLGPGGMGKGTFSPGRWSSLGVRAPSRWFACPGSQGFVYLRGKTAGGTLLFSPRGVNWPEGSRLCRLVPLTLWVSRGRLYGDFHDGSGEQPLVTGLSGLKARRRGHRLEVRLEAGDGVRERAWRWEP